MKGGTGEQPKPIMFPLSKYRVLGLFNKLLQLNALCYAVKYEEQICTPLSICSPRQFSLHYENVKSTLKTEFERGDTVQEPWLASLIDYVD